MTPASGSAHARNGRGCRQMWAVKCDSTAKGCINKFPWLSQIEQRTNEKDPTPCALHPSLHREAEIFMEIRIHPAKHDPELRLFSPSCLFSSSFDIYSSGNALAATITASSKQQQSRPLVFAVTVVVVGFGRSL